ncbi:hypothetical protein NUU61_006527 [Penicillium alfredii]|uniref:Zn(2)-C6 fungal-type domain-containing protein n=1 Tax=Penicillium alfredii TaxID=1506179 RepID=A0A9W9F126_9EURO|nr:uncharacterized protein NUU61_006527 [Penicillium alfredii]KAJ5091657.1 hypothetical protein NUU61_006527 [Penicillium alfredii]
MGCRTCRARHVKCDETPGACKNCASAGWNCSGYEMTRLSHPSQGRRMTDRSVSLLPRMGVSLPGGSSDERRGFAFFLSQTIPNLTGFFDSSLWSGLVLPMSHAERAVNHAVVAISALHEDMETRGAPLAREDLMNRRQRFALEQYGRSLAVLNQRRHSQDPKLREVILTCCLLFVAFDLMRGHYDPAILHLKQGLAIITEVSHSTGDSKAPGGVDAIAKSLSAAMARLDVQSIFFQGGPILEPAPGDYVASVNITSGFGTLHEARVALDETLCHVIHFLKAVYVVPTEDRLACYQPQLEERRRRILSHFTDYLSQLKSSSDSLLYPADAKEQRGIDLIYLHWITYFILIDTSLAGEEEAVFKVLFPRFKRMLFLSKKVADSFLEDGKPGFRPTMLLDMGIIAPLFLVCWRCHDVETRARALEMLEAWPHREAMWDSRFLVLFAKQLLATELALEFESAQSASQDSLETPKAPARVQDIGMQLSDDQTHVTFYYRRKEPGQAALKQQKVVPLDEND